MKKIIFITLSLVFIFTSQLFAQKIIKEIQNNGFIRIGTSGNQFPFSFKDEEGNLQGVDIELAKDFALEIGVNVKFIELEIDQLIPALINHKIDIILSGFSITSKRNTQILFTDAYYKTGKAILTRIPEIKSGNKKFINKKEITLIVINNSSSLEFAKANYPEANIITGESIEFCKEVLFSGKADGYIGDYELCENLFFSDQNNGDYSFRKISPSNKQEFIGAAVSPDDYLFFNLINNYLKKIDQKYQNKKVEEGWLKYAN